MVGVVVVVVVAAGPVDTRISTEEPFGAFVPAVGFVLMTFPAGTVALACDFVVTVNPA